jgi:hypothetical protein
MTGLPRPRIVLDSGALIDAERNPRSKLITDAREAHRAGQPILLPTVVLAQTWRDRDRQYGLRALSRSCEMLGFPAKTAKRVGGLLKVSGTGDIVDAAVIVSAIEHNAIVLTSDPDDLRLLAEAAEVEVPLITV